MDEPFVPDLIGDELPDGMRGRIKTELAPGERLIWAGRAVSTTNS